MTSMCYDRHHQRSVRATSDMVQLGSRVQPQQKSQHKGHVPFGAAPFGPCMLVAGCRLESPWSDVRQCRKSHAGCLTEGSFPQIQQGMLLGCHRQAEGPCAASCGQVSHWNAIRNQWASWSPGSSHTAGGQHEPLRRSLPCAAWTLLLAPGNSHLFQ